ncbi:hypothetical protein EJB05_44180, partial [Eragrostis curvula]
MCKEAEAPVLRKEGCENVGPTPVQSSFVGKIPERLCVLPIRNAASASRRKSGTAGCNGEEEDRGGIGGEDVLLYDEIDSASSRTSGSAGWGGGRAEDGCGVGGKDVLLRVQQPKRSTRRTCLPSTRVRAFTKETRSMLVIHQRLAEDSGVKQGSRSRFYLRTQKLFDVWMRKLIWFPTSPKVFGATMFELGIVIRDKSCVYPPIVSCSA